MCSSDLLVIVNRTYRLSYEPGVTDIFIVFLAVKFVDPVSVERKSDVAFPVESFVIEIDGL